MPWHPSHPNSRAKHEPEFDLGIALMAINVALSTFIAGKNYQAINHFFLKHSSRRKALNAYLKYAKKSWLAAVSYRKKAHSNNRLPVYQTLPEISLLITYIYIYFFFCHSLSSSWLPFSISNQKRFKYDNPTKCLIFCHKCTLNNVSLFSKPIKNFQLLQIDVNSSETKLMFP